MIVPATINASPEVLPSLNVQDAETEGYVSIGGLTGWDDKYLQSQTVSMYPLSFQDVGTLSDDGDTNTIWCQRLSKVIVRAAFSVLSATANIRIIWYDQNLVELMSESVTITASSRTDSDGLYLAPIQVFETYGATRASIAVDTISSGTIGINLAGV